MKVVGCLITLAARSVAHRPSYVMESLAREEDIFYFGLGSNMLRSKLENRGANGSKIEIVSMEPAFVPNYRLSFNMRGFAPLEPAMGAMEPIDSISLPLFAYDKPECHGALVRLTVANYEKLMRSEGVGANITKPGYEEIMVTAIPYDTGKKPVQAVALRARPHVRLKRDLCPSKRYMNILRQGAAELQLRPCYQQFLEQHPIQTVPNWLRRIAINNLIFTFQLSSLLKWRGISRLQNWLLSRVYVPSTAQLWQTVLSQLVSAVLLLPGSILGRIIRACFELPPHINAFVEILSESKDSG